MEEAELFESAYAEKSEAAQAALIAAVMALPPQTAQHIKELAKADSNAFMLRMMAKFYADLLRFGEAEMLNYLSRVVRKGNPDLEIPGS